MSSKQHFDAVVIGTGQGGDPLARALANAGRKTALIERALVGGTCVNYGCTPTKALYNTARVAHLARRANDFGIITTGVAIDMRQAMKRVHAIVEDFRSGTESRIRETKNLHLIFGHATFLGEKRLQVNSDEISADQIFVNVGTRAFVPPIPGLETVPFLDNVGILALDELPESLIVLGGGYIGLEFGQMFQRLGSQVTIIERCQRLIEREDEDVCETATKFLREDGVRVITGLDVAAIRKEGSRILVEMKDSAKIEGSHLLVAIGRTPNTDDLGLDKIGVKTDDHGYIKVNERLETDAAGVFALGDVKGGPAFTHISYDDYRILKANLIDGGSRTTKDRPVPYVMFLDPQLGRVGLNEGHAKKEGIKVRVAKIDAKDIARPVEMAETRGFIKVLIDDSDCIVGVTTFCVEGGELLASLQVAMMAKLPYTALRDGVFAHPTLAESMNNLLMQLQ